MIIGVKFHLYFVNKFSLWQISFRQFWENYLRKFAGGRAVTNHNADNDSFTLEIYYSSLGSH